MLPDTGDRQRRTGLDFFLEPRKTLGRSPRGPAGRFLETAGTGGNALGPKCGGGHQFDHVLARALRTFGRGVRR